LGQYQAAGDDVYEPSLGSNGSINQNNWSRGPRSDLEEQCDDEGAIDCDLEPDDDNEEDNRRLPAYLTGSRLSLRRMCDVMESPAGNPGFFLR